MTRTPGPKTIAVARPTGAGVEASLLAGEHALHTDGDLRASRHWFDLAYREAEQAGDERAVVLAALGLGGLWVHEHRSAATAALVQARQRHALELVEPGSTLALRLRARLAAEVDYRAGSHGEIMAIVGRARQTGDPVARAEALNLAHHCVLGPEHGELRRWLAEELAVEGARTGRRGDLLMGLLWQTVNLFLAADPHAQRRLIELRESLARDDHLAAGYVVRAIEVTLNIRAGQFAHAETLAAECAEYGAVAGDLDSTGWYGAQLMAIRWYQGRIGESLPMLNDLVHSPTLSAVDNSYFAALAVAAATAGDLRCAAGMLARLSVSELPRSSSWLVTMYGLVEAAHLLTDIDTSAQAYAALEPFARLPMMASLGVACFGSAQHALGVAALTTGDLNRAVRHFRAAVRENLALGHWPATVVSRWRLAQALTRAGRDTAAAATELVTAAREAARLDMPLPDQPIRGLIAGGHAGPGFVGMGFAATDLISTGPATAGPVTARSAAARPAAARSTAAGRVVCRRQGRQWLVAMGDRMVLVEHGVGLLHLAVLLANPGHEIPAIDLAAGAAATSVVGPVRASSAQPILDEMARSAYHQRLAQLQTEIDELVARPDLDRAARLRATRLRTDRDWLAGEIAAATGVRGRPRHFTGDEERARVAVTKAIRRCLARIAKADSVIGAQLHATVRTGRRCCYQPDVTAVNAAALSLSPSLSATPLSLMRGQAGDEWHVTCSGEP